MPTFELTRSCSVDWEKLTPEQQARFRVVLQRFIQDAQPRSSSATWKASSRAWPALSRGSQAVS